MRCTRVLPLPFVALAFAGCATITTGVDADARRAGVTTGAEVPLTGNWDGVKVYVDGAPEPARIVTIQRYTFRQAVGNQLRQEVAKQSAMASSRTMLGRPVSYQWTEYSTLKPAIYLSQRREHHLRLVRPDGSEATLTMRPHVGMKYVFFDWCCTMLTGVVVDATTKKWKVFDELDVSAAFPGSPGEQEADRMLPYAAHIVAVQEAFRRRNGRYAKEQEIIAETIAAGYSSRIALASPTSYAVFLGRAHDSRKKKACVFYVGDLGDRLPETLKERKRPDRELQLACDD